MGSVNDLCQMSNFSKFYKGEGFKLLSKFGNNEELLLPVPFRMKEELVVVAKIAKSACAGLPIPSRPMAAPLSTLDFYSDAAGAKYNLQGGRVVIDHQKDRGVCVFGGDSPSSVWICSKVSWPMLFLSSKDDKGTEYGRKSTTLELIGMLLPFIAFPERIAGKYIRFWIDNKAICYGWENGYVKFDNVASSILKWINLLACAIGTVVYVQHVPRLSNSMPSLADEYSRKQINTFLSSTPHAEFRECEGIFPRWLENPSVTEDLQMPLLSELILKLNL